MSNTLIYIALLIAVAACGAAAYLHQQVQDLGKVTNTQGQVIMLMIETPEIGKVLKEEIQRRENQQKNTE